MSSVTQLNTSDEEIRSAEITESEQRIAEIRATIRKSHLRKTVKPMENLLDYIVSVPAQIAAAVEAEREGCARVLEGLALSLELNDESAEPYGILDDAAAAIRARGGKHEPIL